MTIAVTGATGHLGRLAIDALLERGIEAADLIAVGRSADKLAALGALGVQTRQAEYSDEASLTAAFAGADKLLMISGSEVGQRVAQHTNVLEAAKAAGIKQVAYTSTPDAQETTLVLAPEHKVTEQLIIQSGIPFTFLRNGWYTENYAQTIEAARVTGAIVASVGDGRVASASRKDYAEAAAVVLTESGHEGAVYELAGDSAWHYDELASTIGELIGRPVVFRDVPAEELVAHLVEVGLDQGTAGFLAALDGNIREGILEVMTGDLSRLIGRPTTSLADGLAELVRSTEAAA
ncbi:SDR family oxidoreductase [Diaminobutyricimonas sp. TR449]|uniref:SDR family oxidoreductase n=1 Tax=Diaminobutyricimonas sp. TR449 TaxID=2708076 RepID=UPI001420DC7F|nr:SDR family oxidoreductase [Diaminobutyricimonas sp. TR449]